MKVLDLQCAQQHMFEGWFASEGDFLSQLDRGLIECPVCANVSITKRLSAPRLNLGTPRVDTPASQENNMTAGKELSVQSAWMAVARHIVANTTDVGDKFAEEARKIHYGEGEGRAIRGQTSRAEAEALLDEGIAVMPFLLPEGLKGQLQ